MKKQLLLILTIGVLISVKAQVYCTHAHLKNYRQSLDSNYLKQFKKDRIKDVMNSKSLPQPVFKPYIAPANAQSLTGVNTNSNAHYVIPIAIHVVHDGSAVGTGCNISNAQIINQINELNNYFAPYHIQFCPATVYPDSSAFYGITRREDSLTNYRMGLDNDAL